MRTGNGTRVKCLLRQADHDGGVLADGVEHDGPLEFGSHLAEDVNTFGFEGTQMGEGAVGHGACDTVDS